MPRTDQIETVIDNLQPLQAPLPLQAPVPYKARMVAVRGHFRLNKWIGAHARLPPSEVQRVCVLPRGTPIEYVPPLKTEKREEVPRMKSRKKITLKIDQALIDTMAELIDRDLSFFSNGQIIECALREFFGVKPTAAPSRTGAR